MTDVRSIPLGELTSYGNNLHRPECVLCTADGSVYVSDWGGGVCRIAADRTQRRIVATDAPAPIKPNGIALREDGSFLLANLGDAGGVWQLTQSGSVTPYLTEVDGVTLPPANFVLADKLRRTWITVSTRRSPRSMAYRPDVRDGFIVVVDKRGSRVVADSLGYTNEVQVDPSGRWLYVNETFARRTSRFAIGANGSLGKRETVTEYGEGTYPDGLCFDEEQGFWVVSIVSNRVIRVDAGGRQTVVIEDVDGTHLAKVESAFQSGTMGRDDLDAVHSRRLRSVSSIAFGGQDRRTCYLGNLLGDRITTFASPVSGVKPVHWDFSTG